MLKLRRGSASFSTHATVPCGLGSELRGALAQFSPTAPQPTLKVKPRERGTAGKRGPAEWTARREILIEMSFHS